MRGERVPLSPVLSRLDQGRSQRGGGGNNRSRTLPAEAVNMPVLRAGNGRRGQQSISIVDQSYETLPDLGAPDPR